MRSRRPPPRTAGVDDEAAFAYHVVALLRFVVLAHRVDVDVQPREGWRFVRARQLRRREARAWLRAASSALRTCKRLLPKQPLRLPVELLDELARKNARVHDLHPAPDAELAERKL